jgi:DNA-binding NarL/FixJ family response regulator
MTGACTLVAVQSPRRLVRDALSAYLSGWSEFDVVGQTGEVDALYALCALRQPDTVLVDAERLGVETVTELGRLRRTFPGVQVVVAYGELAPRALSAAMSADVTTLVPASRGLSGVLRALRAGGRTAPHRPVAGGVALTERELEIVSLLSSGHSVPEIAGLLRISPHTVENHKRRIYVKLGVSGQVRAVSKATSLGLVEPDPASRLPDRLAGSGAEPGRPPLVTVRGPAGPCLDEIVQVLVGYGLPHVLARTARVDGREHWALWHRGPRPVVLLDPAAEDWRFAHAHRGPVVLVWTAPPDLGEVVDALLRGVRALLSPYDVPAELPTVLSLVSHGYVALPAAHVDELAQWLVGRVPERPGGVPDLTAREHDILDSIACGHTVRQTARTLGIAAKTVENTQARLFRKLGAHNRSGALTIAYRLGLVEPTSG